jgi:cell division protein FtsL
VKTDLNLEGSYMKRLVIVAIAVVCISTVTYLIVQEQAANYRLEKEIQALGDAIVEINDEKRKTLLQVEEMRHPQRIQERAEANLEMQRGREDQFVYIPLETIQPTVSDYQKSISQHGTQSEIPPEHH